MYPLGAITSLSGVTVNGSSLTYFLSLLEDDVVVLNSQSVSVDSVISDSKFTVKTAFTSGASGDILYSTSKIVWLRYQIWKIDTAIANYNLDLLGVSEVKNGNINIQLNSSKTPISELLRLKSDYENQLSKCQAEEDGGSIWLVRRTETGTL